MARLKFICLFTLPHAINKGGGGGGCPFDVAAALCSGLAALSCGWTEF